MTPLIAATATQDMPTPWGRVISWTALALTVWFLYYLVACWWRPFKPCRCCKGTGKHHRKDRKAFRKCWWCSHRGYHLRIGRRVWNRFAKVRKAAG